jgi:hypothetical protein
MHDLLFILTCSLYVRVTDLQGVDRSDLDYLLIDSNHQLQYGPRQHRFPGAPRSCASQTMLTLLGHVPPGAANLGSLEALTYSNMAHVSIVSVLALLGLVPPGAANSGSLEALTWVMKKCSIAVGECSVDIDEELDLGLSSCLEFRSFDLGCTAIVEKMGS